MSALRLIDGEASQAPAPAALMRVDARTRRPGLAHEQIELALSPRATQHLACIALADGLPAPLLAVIAIESERALNAAASDRGARLLARCLDWAARRASPAWVRHTQLAAYAAALRSPPAFHADVPAPALELLVPYHTLVAWEIAAHEEGSLLGDWARAQLSTAGKGRRLWEASAAERGETLAEWVARLAGDVSVPR